MFVKYKLQLIFKKLWFDFVCIQNYQNQIQMSVNGTNNAPIHISIWDQQTFIIVRCIMPLYFMIAAYT